MRNLQNDSSDGIFKAIGCLVIAQSVFAIVIIVLIVYAGIHFIGKVW